MMNGQFVISSGVRDFFVSEDDLRRRARQGLLRPGDRVYHPGLSRWLYAREVAEVEGELRQAADLLRSSQIQPPRPSSAAGPALAIAAASEEVLAEAAESQLLVPVNRAAVAGFLCAGLALLPIFGLLLATAGLVLSRRGLRAAPGLFGSGERLAQVGLGLSVLLLPAQVLLLRWLVQATFLWLPW